MNKNNAKRKVAVYARVSTEHEAQISALSNQVQYYDNLFELHPDWEFLGYLYDNDEDNLKEIDGFPVGAQLMAKHFCEKKLFEVVAAYEK